METEFEIESYTESGLTLFINVTIQIYQDETPDSYTGSKRFWTYDILKIKSHYKKHGETHDFAEDSLNSDHWDDIKQSCINEVHSYSRAA